MGLGAAAVEISSDEDDAEKMPTSGKRKNSPEDVLDWVDKLLGEDCDTIGDDLDDSAVIQEFLESLLDLTNDAVGEKESVVDDNKSVDDDDCVILDCDPDKAVSVAKEEGTRRDAAEDELQIVAEKGELACRDFPHPRNLCATLPFNTSSHASHCSMCHCYVCDSPAPCAFWGKGTVHTDHCHATDKDAKWKKVRQSFKRKIQPTITLPRAASPMPRTTILRNRYKRAHVVPPVYTPSTANQLQRSRPPRYQIQPARALAFQTAKDLRENVQRYLALPPSRAPIGSQGCQCQPLSYPQLAPNTVVGTGVPLSRCTSLATPGTQRLEGALADTRLKETLSNLAYELGVPDYNIDKPLGQQSTSTQTLHPTELLVSVQRSYTAANSQVTNQASGGIVHSSGSVQPKHLLCQLNSQSNLIPSESAPRNSVASRAMNIDRS